MTFAPSHRRTHSGAAVVGVLMCALMTPVQAAKDGIFVRDMKYGEVLFEFFSEDYFSALTKLMVAQGTDSLPNHSDEAELLRGGLFLSYGLHQEAGRIFEQLLASRTTPEVRDKAYFYLGKVRYQRGYYAEAGQSLAEVRGSLGGDLNEERLSMQAQIYIAQGLLDPAINILQNWQGSEAWAAYASYNLGVALVRANRLEDAAPFLRSVGIMPAEDEEMRSLRDRANLALGFAYLQAEQDVEAKPWLQRVRLDGPFSNKALLGVGWASVAEEDYMNALVPWLELTQRDLLDSAVQESLLAVPYAYRQLSANEQAVDAYNRAIDVYQQEIQRIEAAIGMARAGELLRIFEIDEAADFTGWDWELEEVPVGDEAKYLYDIIAGHSFQEGLKNYRDLRMLKAHLHDWMSRLDVYADMLDTRSLAYESAVTNMPEDAHLNRLEELQQRYDDLRGRVDQASETGDPVALATAREKESWDQIVELEGSPALGTSEAARTKLELLKGVLLWDLQSDYKVRLFQAKRDVSDLEQQIVQAQENYQDVAAGILEVPAMLEGFDVRVADLGPGVERLQTSIDQGLVSQVGFLSDLAIRDMVAQRDRLIRYRSQAQFAIATMYDRSLSSNQTGAVSN